jgi:hypothetical protein
LADGAHHLDTITKELYSLRDAQNRDDKSLIDAHDKVCDVIVTHTHAQVTTMRHTLSECERAKVQLENELQSMRQEMTTKMTQHQHALDDLWTQYRQMEV